MNTSTRSNTNESTLLCAHSCHCGTLHAHGTVLSPRRFSLHSGLWSLSCTSYYSRSHPAETDSVYTNTVSQYDYEYSAVRLCSSGYRSNITCQVPHTRNCTIQRSAAVKRHARQCHSCQNTVFSSQMCESGSGAAAGTHDALTLGEHPHTQHSHAHATQPCPHITAMPTYHSHAASAFRRGAVQTRVATASSNHRHQATTVWQSPALRRAGRPR